MNCTLRAPSSAAASRLKFASRPGLARRMRGLTLIEMAITLAVAATLVGAMAPTFSQARERRHLEGVAAQLETDIQHARSLAVAQGVSVRMGFSSPDGASCYVVHTGSAGACHCAADGSAVCTAGARALQSTRWGGELPVRVVSNASSMLFDATKGTVSPTATIKVLGNGGKAIHQVVNIMGRVRSCSPGAAVAGYPAC